MLDLITKGPDILIRPFYYMGVVIWNAMLEMIGYTAVLTPESFSAEAWGYVSGTLYPFMAGIGAMILNISFYIGYLRQVNNLKQDITLELVVECGIKAVVGNAFILSGLKLMKLFFGIASDMSGIILFQSPVIFAQESEEIGSVLFYAVFGFLYFIVAIVCSAMIFIAVYGRYLQIYMLVATMPVAIGTLPGGHGVEQTAVSWLRTFLAKTFEIVLVMIAIVIAAKLCNVVDFLSTEDGGAAFGGVFQSIQNIFTMVLLTASVKGMEIFMHRAFGL